MPDLILIILTFFSTILLILMGALIVNVVKLKRLTTEVNIRTKCFDMTDEYVKELNLHESNIVWKHHSKMLNIIFPEGDENA